MVRLSTADRGPRGFSPPSTICSEGACLVGSEGLGGLRLAGAFAWVRSWSSQACQIERVRLGMGQAPAHRGDLAFQPTRGGGNTPQARRIFTSCRKLGSTIPPDQLRTLDTEKPNDRAAAC
jgi:hypothetical protein